MIKLVALLGIATLAIVQLTNAAPYYSQIPPYVNGGGGLSSDSYSGETWGPLLPYAPYIGQENEVQGHYRKGHGKHGHEDPYRRFLCNGLPRC